LRNIKSFAHWPSTVKPTDKKKIEHINRTHTNAHTHTPVFHSLAAGGQFILEFQEWSSYKKKKSLTETFKVLVVLCVCLCVCFECVWQNVMYRAYIERERLSEREREIETE